VGLAVVLVLLPAPALAQLPPRDSASGFGRVLQTNFFGGAEAGPNGEDPVGSLTLSGFLNLTTATTCLNISGNAVVAAVESSRAAAPARASSAPASIAARRSTGSRST
jgi:hypothetical protein